MALVLRFLAHYARRNLGQYALGLAMLACTNFAVVRIPTLIGEALNVLESGGSAQTTQARGIALELVGWAITLVVVRTLSRALFFNPGRDIEFRLGADVFRHLLGLQRPFFDTHKVGELVSVLSNDTTSVRLLVGFAGLQICNVAVAIPMHLVQMLRTDEVLTAWCIAPVVAGAVYMRWTVQRFYGMVRASMEELAKLSNRVLESYSGVATIRAHGAQAAALERFDEQNDAYLRLQLGISAVRAFSLPVLGFAGFVGTGIVLWVGGNRVLAGAIRVGDLATFTALLVSLVAILMSLAWVLAAVSRGVVSLRRVRDLLEVSDDVPDVCDQLGANGPPSLEVRALSFNYPGAQRQVLEDVSFCLPAGATLGVFGHTGAGKTTLIHLISRVYTPPRDTIMIDGHDVRDLSLSELRERMAVVPQDPFLFSTTLQENVRLAGEHSMHEEGIEPVSIHDAHLDHVLDLAALREDLAGLPKGLDTIVGERGVMLSGGQRQRTALARALYRGAPLLLLDDVLSAVDHATEARLVKTIRALRAGVEGERAPTTIIVSHRTSVLEHADEILVLEGGRVIERGTHRQLLARAGVYARSHAHQQRSQNEGSEHDEVRGG